MPALELDRYRSHLHSFLDHRYNLLGELDTDYPFATLLCVQVDNRVPLGTIELKLAVVGIPLVCRRSVLDWTLIMLGTALAPPLLPLAVQIHQDKLAFVWHRTTSDDSLHVCRHPIRTVEDIYDLALLP